MLMRGEMNELTDPALPARLCREAVDITYLAGIR